MTQVWNWTWLTVAFLAELGALAALAAWGWSAGGSTAARVLLAVAAAGGAAVLWGVRGTAGAGAGGSRSALLVKVVVFGAAVLALVATGHPPTGGAPRRRRRPQLGAVDPAPELTRSSRPQTKAARTSPGRCTSQRLATPGSTLVAPGSPMTSSRTCCQTRRSVPVAGGTGDPGARTRCSLSTEPPGPLEHLPVEVRPQRQRPAADLDVEVAEPAVLHLLGRPQHRRPQAQPARRPRGVLERLPARVRGVRLAPRRPQPAEGLGDQVGPEVGHPPQEHEAELAPRQTPHPPDPATISPC